MLATQGCLNTTSTCPRPQGRNSAPPRLQRGRHTLCSRWRAGKVDRHITRGSTWQTALRVSWAPWGQSGGSPPTHSVSDMPHGPGASKHSPLPGTPGNHFSLPCNEGNGFTSYTICTGDIVCKCLKQRYKEEAIPKQIERKDLPAIKMSVSSPSRHLLLCHEWTHAEGWKVLLQVPASRERAGGGQKHGYISLCHCLITIIFLLLHYQKVLSVPSLDSCKFIRENDCYVVIAQLTT